MCRINEVILSAPNMESSQVALLLSGLCVLVFFDSAVGHCVFVYASLGEESLLLARHCSLPQSSRVKALRHSLGEASTI